LSQPTPHQEDVALQSGENVDGIESLVPSGLVGTASAAKPPSSAAAEHQPSASPATRRDRLTFERLLRCLTDLGGVTREILTDRDVAFCIGATSDGHSILAPEWVDLCTLLGVVPKACRPYQAKTKGKVERMIRELS
jgi:hypothetical protein